MKSKKAPNLPTHYTAAQRRKFSKQAARACILDHGFVPLIGVLLAVLPGFLAGLLMQFGLLTQGPRGLVWVLVYALVQIFIGAPLYFGLIRYLNAQLRPHRYPIRVMLCYLTDRRYYVRSVRLFLWTLLHALPWIIPAAAIVFGYTYFRLNGDPNIMQDMSAFYALTAEVSGVMMVVSIPLIGIMLPYLCTPLIERSQEFPNPTAHQIIRICCDYFRGHRLEMIVFAASFVGWQLLSMYTLGVGTLFYMAYMGIAVSRYFEQLYAEDISRKLGDRAVVDWSIKGKHFPDDFSEEELREYCQKMSPQDLSVLGDHKLSDEPEASDDRSKDDRS